MLLYHGTSSRHLESIVNNGLLPRGSGIGNWSHLPSRDSVASHVYLTSTYGGYYAVAAVGNSKDDLLLVEVDTDLLSEDNLLPDEDFVVAHASDIPSGVDKWEWVKKNIEHTQEHWRASLEQLGVMAHRGPVPTSAITRIAQLSYSDCPALVIAVADACVGVAGYQFCGGMHQKFTRFIMTDPVSAEEICPLDADILESPGPNEFKEMSSARLAAWAEILAEPKSKLVYVRPDLAQIGNVCTSLGSN